MLHDATVDDDTLESLTVKLKERLTLADNDNKGDDSNKLSLFQIRLDNLRLSKTSVKPSSIHGRGLFACCDGIREGDLLTCYPGDALVYVPPRLEGNSEPIHSGYTDHKDWIIEWARHVTDVQDVQSSNGEALSDELKGYIIHATGDYGALGLPSLDSNPAYFGHFANDGGTMPTCQAELAPYIIESFDKANAVHKEWRDCHLVTVATRDIAKGEEILVTYGPHYWMDINDISDEDEGDDDNE